MRKKIRGLGFTAGSLAGLLFMACVPLFTAGLFQTLSLSFKFDLAIAEGEERIVHQATFPEAVKLKKNFVQVSGRLSGDGLPTSATLKGEVANPDTGKVGQRISLKLNIGDDGRFSTNAKIKKNVKAGEVLTVTLEPKGSALAKNTEITLCVDLVKKKGDLSAVPACVADDGDDGDDGGGAVTFSALQDDFFTPTCARAGCHSSGASSGGLILSADVAYGNLVDSPSQQQPQFNRVTPNEPDNSYLIKKLRGDLDITGSRMPAGGPFLTDEQIERFVSWIDAGAPNN